MQHDLRRDFSEIYDHLVNQVRSFDPKGRNVLGKPGPIKLIQVGYEYSQAGWVVIVFDMRKKAEPDGEWTARIEGNELERPHWLEAGEANLENPITLIQWDGKKTDLPAESELAEPLGEMVKAVLFKARKDGIFSTLPKAPKCELGIEHFEGAFGWPEYEARGKDNLI